MSIHPKKKKDFKIRQDVIEEFERLAPRGKQTAIIESLIIDWIDAQHTAEQEHAMRQAYARLEKGN